MACASCCATAITRLAQRRAVGASRACVIGAWPAWLRGDQHEGVVGRGVAVDGDAVEASGRPLRAPAPASARGAIAASVAMKPSMVAMFGRIMPAPLLMPVMVTVRAADRAPARDAALGSVSVVMMASAATRPVVGLGRSASAAGRPASMRSTGSGSMITPVENGSTCSGATPSSARQRGAGRRAPRQAVGAGAGVGIAGVDHAWRGCPARRQMLAAHLHRRGAEAVLREHAGHRRAFVEQQHRQVLAVGLADAGLGDADAHAGAPGCRSAAGVGDAAG